MPQLLPVLIVRRAIRLVALTLAAASSSYGQPPTQALRYPLPGAVPAAPGAVLPPAPPVAPQVPQPQAVLFEPGQIVARIGDKTILYGDVAPTVNLTLALAKNDAERQAIEAQREAFVRSVVMQAVQTKMLLIEFERGMPSELRSDAKKRAEAEGKINKSIATKFEESLNDYRERVVKADDEELEQLMQQNPLILRLALLMKQRGLISHGELDLALREMGTSLAQQVKDFGENAMGMEAARKELGIGNKNDPRYKVTHLEMLDYYQEHLKDYQVPAKASFEILTARFARFNGDRQATLSHAAMMGNEVFLGGVPFAAVAKKHSQEPLASDGGAYKDISPGGLASKAIDQAVFTLEVGKLSQIIEDEQGYHIIRVTQRTPAGMVPFEEAQEKIRKKIENQKQMAVRQKYFGELRERTKIWTIYDPPVPTGSAPAAVTR